MLLFSAAAVPAMSCSVVAIDYRVGHNLNIDDGLQRRSHHAQESEDAAPLFGEIEVDESNFGGHRKGRRSRGAAGKVQMFGLVKCRGKVIANVVSRFITDFRQ